MQHSCTLWIVLALSLHWQFVSMLITDYLVQSMMMNVNDTTEDTVFKSHTVLHCVFLRRCGQKVLLPWSAVTRVTCGFITSARISQTRRCLSLVSWTYSYIYIVWHLLYCIISVSIPACHSLSLRVCVYMKAAWVVYHGHAGAIS